MATARAALFGLLVSVAAATVAMAHDPADPAGSGFVLKESEGEILHEDEVHTQIIKIAPEHSPALGLATSRFRRPGRAISVHAHEHDDEAFFVHRGSGTFILGDARIPIAAGDVVFIPKGQWHGFENAGTDTLLVWAISSSKYLELHRMFFSDGPDPSEEEGEAILRRYGFLSPPPPPKQEPPPEQDPPPEREPQN